LSSFLKNTTSSSANAVQRSQADRSSDSRLPALLKDAPILIADEPTAALDTVTEQAILEAMRRLMKGRTTIIIAHRLSTIRHADQILVLNRVPLSNAARTSTRPCR
jgi:ATP-binding cassette, subfamily B, bacterial